MTQINNYNSISSQSFHNVDNDTYTYKNSQVKIITVFTDSRESTALVEDENGEIFQVPRDSLR